MDFVYLLRVLLKRKWIILGAALLAAVLAFYLTRNEKKFYRSSAQIATGFAIEDAIKVNNVNFDPFAADTKFQNAITEFTSEPVVSLLGYQLILHDLKSPNPFRQLSDEQKSRPEYRDVNIEQAKQVFQKCLDTMGTLTSFNADERKLIEFLALYGYDVTTLNKNLNLFRRERTDYLQIDFKSENPELSAFVVNNVYQQYLRYFKQVRQEISTTSIDTLQAIMERKKLELDFKNATLQKMGYVEEGTAVSTQDAAGQLRTRLQEERSKKTQKEFELRRIVQKLQATASSGSSRALVNNDELLNAQKAAADAKLELDNDPNNKEKEDRYVRLNNIYLGLRRQSGSASGTVPERAGESRSDLLDKKATLEFDIAGLQQTINSYESNIAMLEGEVSAIARQGATIESVKKERELANKEYIDAKERYNSAMGISGSAVNNFRQTVVGQPALNPEPSKRMMIVAMSGVAALATSILIIVLLTYLDSSIKTPVIFQRTVGLKLISLVNFMDMKNKRLEDIVANKHQTETVSDRNKFNAFRESIRKLRYEIEKTGKKVFLFTSTKKGQGKTTLIQALAYSMSLSKKKILIIDTNFCNPDLTVQLNADPVLEKILPYKTGQVSLIDQVKKLSKDIGVGTVYAIGSEGGDYTPSEILPRENILHYLKELTAEFDYIFLEGPPLNDFSDSKELAEYVDGVIAVFSAVHIVKQIDKQSIAFFKELNGKFCGSILNMVDLKNVNVT